MGFLSQKRVLFKSVEVEFELIKDLLFKRFEFSKSRVEVGERTRPAVAIDANLIGYQYIYQSCGAVGALKCICDAFTSKGIDVHLVADGPNRHHSKRATIKRRGEREAAKINAIRKRLELSAAIQAQTDANDPTVKELSKKLRTLEKAGRHHLSANFLEGARKLAHGSN
jgi:hypothetical protein